MFCARLIEEYFEYDVKFASTESVFWIDHKSTKQPLFQRVRDEATAYCEDCFVPHKVIKSGSGKMSISCSAGTRLVEELDLARWRIDPFDLIRCLQGGLELNGVADERHYHKFWYLGEYRTDNHFIPVWLMRACNEPADIQLVRKSLEDRSPDKAGVIFASNPLASSINWPRGSKVLRLSDAVSIVANRVLLARSAFHARLPENVYPRRARGRPIKGKLDYREHFAMRAKSNEAVPSSLTAEATALRNLSVLKFGEDQACSVGHIENLIRDAYNAWKSTRQS